MDQKDLDAFANAVLGEPEEFRKLLAELAGLAVLERRYLDMVESVNSIIVRWDTKLKIEFINSFGARFFGYKKDELEGRNLFETIVDGPDSTGMNLKEMIDNILTNPEKYQNHENENVLRDKSKIWISWSNKAVLSDEGELAGILSVGNDITALKRTQNDLKRALSTNETLLRELEQLNRNLDKMARTDQLTELLNRRSGMDVFEEEFFRASRHKYPLGLLMIDIDHFKKVNDTYGHSAGDSVLKVVAKAITTSVRQEDTVARIGGEEIIVVLPYASTARCWNAGERLRTAVEQVTAEKTAAGQLPCKVTISVGGASTESGAPSEEQLLKLADEMLYKSKDSGRNMVTIAGLEETKK